jgi:hypothetical protein
VSYRNLASDLQDFFRRLSLHPGATVEEFTAAALADASVPEAAEHLDISHREALLTEVGYRRYSMHDLIRRYARDRAAADPAAGRERALDRLLDVYTRAAWAADVWLARQTGTGQTPAPSAAPVAIPDLSDATQALAWARTERVNLLACLDHVTSTGQHARVVALTAALATLFRQEGPWAESISRCAAGVRAARRRHRGGGYPAGRRAAGPFAAAEGADRAVATCHSESPRTGQRLLHLLLPQASMAENPMQGSTRPAVFTSARTPSADRRKRCRLLGLGFGPDVQRDGVVRLHYPWDDLNLERCREQLLTPAQRQAVYHDGVRGIGRSGQLPGLAAVHLLDRPQRSLHAVLAAELRRHMPGRWNSFGGDCWTNSPASVWPGGRLASPSPVTGEGTGGNSRSFRSIVALTSPPVSANRPEIKRIV